jgi:hypothetical protein
MELIAWGPNDSPGAQMSTCVNTSVPWRGWDSLMYSGHLARRRAGYAGVLQHGLACDSELHSQGTGAELNGQVLIRLGWEVVVGQDVAWLHVVGCVLVVAWACVTHILEGVDPVVPDVGVGARRALKATIDVHVPLMLLQMLVLMMSLYLKRCRHTLCVCCSVLLQFVFRVEAYTSCCCRMASIPCTQQLAKDTTRRL